MKHVTQRNSILNRTGSKLQGFSILSESLKMSSSSFPFSLALLLDSSFSRVTYIFLCAASIPQHRTLCRRSTFLRISSWCTGTTGTGGTECGALSQEFSLCRAIFLIRRKFSSGRLYPRCFLKKRKKARENARVRFFTHACVFILPCDTWLLRRFLPAIVARRLLAFLEFYMPEEVSHAGVQPHLHE